MSHKDNADLRSTGEGGWCYTEHELFSVFLPLIGADGGMVYMAMTRLVPLAAVRAEFPVTVETASRESCVSRSTTHRKIRELVALGMVLETRHSNRRPSTYKLVPLRELARVGVEELKRRLGAAVGVPPGDTGADGGKRGRDEDRTSIAAQGRSGRIDSLLAAAAAVVEDVEPSDAAGESGIPRWDTEGKGGLKAASGTPVSQNRGLVSQKRPPVSQGGTPFNQEEEERDRKNNPLPPKGDGGGSSPDHGKGEGPTLPWGELHRGEPGYAQSLPIAARWVLAECGISAMRRLETMVVGQLQIALDAPRGLEARDTTLQEAAADMVASWHKYQELCQRQELRIQWGVVQFFGEGLWARSAAWPRKAEAPSNGKVRGAGVGVYFPSGSPGVEQTKALLAREAQEKEDALAYWRQMKAKGLPIYAAEAPRWVRETLEKDE